MSATPCTQPGCSGTVVDGYCDVCGLPPASSGPAPGAAASAGATAASVATAPMSSWRGRRGRRCRQRRPGSGRRVHRHLLLGAARVGRAGDRARRVDHLHPAGVQLVAPDADRPARWRSDDRPPAPEIDAAAAVMTDPSVPEDKRFCPSAASRSGAVVTARPGGSAASAPSAASRFSFEPRLKAGDLVAGQYEVAGCLAHGGLGWIYLARDRNVSNRWVVLRGLLNSADPDALAAAIAEQRFLAQVSHPNIVEIYNFVTHDDAGYIVMEYIGGTSLKSLLKQRMKAKGRTTRCRSTRPSPTSSRSSLPSSTSTTSAWSTATSSRTTSSRSATRSGSSTSAGSGAPTTRTRRSSGRSATRHPRWPSRGVSVASDIYTIGRTLVVLTSEFRGYQSTYLTSLPRPPTPRSSPATTPSTGSSPRPARPPRTTGSPPPTSSASSCWGAP